MPLANAQNPSIGINFSGRASSFSKLLPQTSAGVVAQQNWHNAPGTTSGFDGSLSQLGDSDFAVTGVIFSWEASDSWNGSGLIDETASPDDQLMQGIQKANPNPDLAPVDNTDRMLFTFDNLEPGSSYDVLVYFGHNGGTPRGEVTVNNTTIHIELAELFTGTYVEGTSTDPEARSTGVNYVHWQDVPHDDNNQVQIEVKKLIENPQLTDGIGVSAIQLIKRAGDWPLPQLPVFIEEPQNLLVGEGKVARFDVMVNGNWPVEWLKNGDPVQGPTIGGNVLRFVAAQSDNNAMIQAVIHGLGDPVFSSVATLSVDPAESETIVPGWIVLRRYDGIEGTNPKGLFQELNYPDKPTNITLWPQGLSLPVNIGNSYATLAEFVMKAPATGDYHIFTSSDDGSMFWLNQTGSLGIPLLPDEAVEDPLIYRTVWDGEGGFAYTFREVTSRGGPVSSPGDLVYPTTQTPVSLDSSLWYGGKYALQEGYGGDYAHLAMRATTDPRLVGFSFDSPFTVPSEQVGFIACPSGNQITIIAHPASITTEEFSPGTFSVDADTLPMAGAWNAQWQIDLGNGFVDIPNGFGATYTDPGQPVGSHPVRAKVVFLGGVTFSDPATWVVTPRSPQILRDPQDVLSVVGNTVRFQVETSSPSWPVQWLINGTEVDPSQREQTFFLDTTAAHKDAQIVARVGGSSTIDSNPARLTLDDPAPEQLTRGFARVKRYREIEGTQVSEPFGTGRALFLNPKFLADDFDDLFYLPGLDLPQTIPDLPRFGALIEGFVSFPESGDHHWFLASDDGSELFVNSVGGTFETLPGLPSEHPDWPAMPSPDAFEWDCCDAFREPDAGDSATSAPIPHDASLLYGVTIAFKEHGGGDWARVATRHTSDTTAANDLPTVAPGRLYTLVSPAGHRGMIQRQPKDVTVKEGDRARLRIGVEVLPVSDPFGVQWQREIAGQFQDVPGAYGDTFDVPNVRLGETYRYRAVVFTLAGEHISNTAEITVLPDLKQHNAWQIVDFSTTDSGLVYVNTLDPDQIVDAAAHGWRLELNGKLAWDYESPATMMMAFGTGTHLFQTFWDLDEARNLVVEYLDENGQLQTEFLAASPRANGQYHRHELVFDPVSGLASYHFDGEERFSWPGSPSADLDGQIAWGAASAVGRGYMNFRNVAFTLLCDGVVARYHAGSRRQSDGPPNPSSQGWIKTPSNPDPDVFDWAVTGEGRAGRPRLSRAWLVNDVSQQPGSVLLFNHALAPAETAGAQSDGWQLRATARLANDYGGEPSQSFLFNDGQTDSGIVLDLRADGALVADLIGVPGPPFELITDRTEARDYHRHELVFAPTKAQDRLTYLFDGMPVHSWDPIQLPDATGEGHVDWGANSENGQGALLVRNVELRVNGHGQVASFQAGRDDDPESVGDPYQQGWLRQGVATEIRERAITPDTFPGSWDCRGLFEFGQRDDQLSRPEATAIDSQGRFWVATWFDGIKVYDSEGAFLFKLARSGRSPGEFLVVSDLAFAPDGNLWITEDSNDRISIFDSNGVFLHSFGSYGGGLGEFNNPQGVAFNGQNEAIIADTNNHRVQIFDLGGGYLRSFGSRGSADGEFEYPLNPGVDSLDRIYIADSRNERVQVFESDGTFVRAFGTEGNGDGEFGANDPSGVAIDSLGQVLVSDRRNRRVQVFDRDGVYQSQFGTCCTGDGRFNWISDIEIHPDGRIVVTDSSQDIVQVFDTAFAFSSKLGSAPTNYGQFGQAYSVDVNHQGEILGVVRNPGKINVFDRKGMFLREYTDFGTGNSFNYPFDLEHAPNGDIVVSLDVSHQIAILDASGAVVLTFGESGEDPGQLNYPGGLAVFGTPSAYEIFVSERQLDRISVFDQDGNFLRTIGTPGSGPGELDYPMDLEFDRHGNLLVADRNNNRIQVFDRAGQFLHSLADGNGPDGTRASFATGLMVDGGNRIFVTGISSITILDENGILLDEIGQWGYQLGQFWVPQNIASDRRGNLYIAEPNSDRFQKLTNCFCLDASGDVDCNGSVDILDIVSGRREINRREFDDRRRNLGDANLDGEVNAEDLDMIIGRVLAP